MAGELSKTTSVLDLNYGTTFTSTDEETFGIVREVYVDPETYELLGSPDQITVAIEPGDKLNESVCVVDDEGDFWIEVADDDFYMLDDGTETSGFDLAYIEGIYGIDSGGYVEPEPPLLAGDFVDIAEGARCTGGCQSIESMSNGQVSLTGKTGWVISGPNIDGDYRVRVPGSGDDDLWYIHESYLTHVGEPQEGETGCDEECGETGVALDPNIVIGAGNLVVYRELLIAGGFRAHEAYEIVLQSLRGA